MKKILLIALSALIWTGCDQKNNIIESPESGIEFELSNLEVSDFESPANLSLGPTSPTQREVSQDVILKNTGNGPQALAISLDDDPGFKIKLNRCGLSLAAGSSCKLSLSFSSRGLFDGSYTGALNVTPSAIIALSSSITGYPNPDLSGTPALTISLSSAFSPKTAIAYRTLNISNTGDGTATNIQTQLGANYSVRLNRCSSNLKPAQSCYIQILQRNHRSSSEPAPENVEISSTGLNTQILNLATGQDASIVPFNFRIGTGSEHSCLINDSGKAYCWGRNDNGQLGDGTMSNSNVPVAVSTAGVLSGKTLTHISSGRYVSCVIDSDGRLYCWGKNEAGVLGANASAGAVSLPVEVTGKGSLIGKTVKYVDVGPYNAVAIDSDGAAHSWGPGSLGRNGDGVSTDRHVPILVKASGALAGKNLVKSSVGVHYSCVLDDAGRAYCWGLGSNGKLGSGNTGVQNDPTPVNVDGVLAGKTLVDISTGSSHSCAVDNQGDAYCWGFGSNGRLGNGSNTDQNLPVSINTSLISGKKLVRIESSETATSALTDEGEVINWGSNGGAGGIPRLEADNISNPIFNKVLKNISTAADTNLNSVIDEDGIVYVTGPGLYGQIGNGTNPSSQTRGIVTPNY